MKFAQWLAPWLAVHMTVVASTAIYSPSQIKPPPVAREFRGAWIASVGNIDWPSQRDLTAEQQKAELLAIFDMARRLNLNALMLQVRPACDALYPSSLEPWSEYLTGQMGKPPRPFYDPLEFAVEEAHKRGLELHAWFNPFRAGHSTRKSPATATHISKSRPFLVRTYGKELWLDPGDKAVHEYTLNVILDVSRRYDVDGVVLDDYFYPYPVRDTEGKSLPFPDWPTWKTYREAGGKLARDDWRRENINIFIQQLYTKVKAQKSWVKVGISPFGIWRPGNPEPVKGFDAFASLYADSRNWLEQGWLDYFVPQLYWSSNAREQSYPDLLKWWCDHNPRKRHVWPGNSVSRVGANRGPDELVNQVRITRQQPGATGNVHWSVRALMRNTQGVVDSLKREVYQKPALVPMMPWLDAAAPQTPKLDIEQTAKGMKVSWQPVSEPASRWVWQLKTDNEWTAEILSGASGSRIVSSADVIAVSAVDRCGNVSPPAVLEKRAP
jgi:uncharacterized lipoprotein YddW (UPF0748 family)